MNYELDSTMYNGKHLQSHSDWERHNATTKPSKHNPKHIHLSWFKLCCCNIKFICEIQLT